MINTNTRLRLALILSNSIGLLLGTAAPCLASDEDFSSQYTGFTKKILLAGVQLERYSLNYRLESCKKPFMAKLAFMSTQEASAATGLAFEVCGDQQFGRGRKRLLAVDKDALGRGLRSAQVGSIIAASGSGYELAANFYQYAKGRHKGLDTASANKFVAAKLKEIDDLIARRKALVDANAQHPAHDRALLEGKILDAMRGTFVNEYATFSTNARSDFITRNLFFLMNASYNTIGACAAEYGWLSLSNPKLNGTSNILFTITGAMAMATPLLCSAQLWLQRRYMFNSQMKKFNGSKDSINEMAALIKESQSKNAGDTGTLIPTLPATERFAMYSDSNHLFSKQLENEMNTMRRLNKVALQDSMMGPAIGSLLMTQGILGTRAYYHYPTRPRTQMDLNYKGSICGTVGTSMAVVGNAAWFLASISYEQHLRKQNRLPQQLIKSRLEHLDEVEKVISAL